MLSEKKSSIAKESIDFLGMVITNGYYQPGPHIATELLKFPAKNLTKKQIQQFLGIVNYVRDFIPRVAIHTSQLSRMLKKQCRPWGPAQTEAVKQLKVIAQSPPTLRIPTTGQRILQTDASDDYWSAILLERIDGVDHFCAHASGQFKDSEKNYHVIYKEILAVKYGIKKFEFHLISHRFLFPESLISRTSCFLTSSSSISKLGSQSMTLLSSTSKVNRTSSLTFLLAWL